MSEISESGLSQSIAHREEIRQPVIFNEVSWGAIFAGVVVALVVQVLLSILGAGVGIASLHPSAGDNPEASTFSLAAGLWYVVAGIIGAFVGGYVAARMSGKTNPTTGALHGLTAWAFTTLVVLYLLTSAVGALVGGAFGGLTTAVSGMSQTMAQTAAPLIASSSPLDVLDARVRATGTDPQALTNAAVNAMRALVTGSEQNADAARKQAAQALATARGIPLDQATQQVAQFETDYREGVAQAKQQALKAADAAASVTSKGALLAFVALILGAIASWLGGRSGVMSPVYAERVIPRRRAP